MRHSWKINLKKHVEVKKRLHNGLTKVFRVGKIKQCVHCGLRKGNASTGWSYSYNQTIYFDKDDRLLSEDKLPFACMKKTDFYLSEEDFLL